MAMSLVARIKELCCEYNTTLIGLEREIGLGRGTIRNWDINSPSADKVQKVANYFGVSVDSLLDTSSRKEMLSVSEVNKQEVLSAALAKLKAELEQEPLSPERVAALTEAIKVLDGLNQLARW